MPIQAIPAIAAVALRAVPAIASAVGRGASALAGRAASSAASGLSNVAARGGMVGKAASSASRGVNNLSPMFQSRVGGAVERVASRAMTNAINRAENNPRVQQVSNRVSNNLSQVQAMLAQGGIQTQNQAKRSSM